MTEPLRVHEYTLTRADALAYESLPRELRGWRFLVLLIWLATAGGVLGLLPEEWIGPEGGWLFWLVGVLLLGIAAAVAIGVMTLARHFRARRRVPAPIAMRVEEWGDYLAITEAGNRVRRLPYAKVGQTILTPGHLFLVAPPDLLILPAHSFADPAEMSALARRIDAAGHDTD